MPGVAFPQTGPVGFGSPPYRRCACAAPPSVVCSAKTAPCPSRFASLPLAGRYLVLLPCFVASSRLASSGLRSACARTCSSGCPIRLSQGDRWLSQVPELPLCAHAPISDPGGDGRTRLCALLSAAFRQAKNVGFSTMLENFGIPSHGLRTRYTRLQTSPRGSPAGSLPTCRLRFGRVGLAPTG